MVATLIPREEFELMRKSGRYPDSEFAAQNGTPYGLRREMLASPLGLPMTTAGGLVFIGAATDNYLRAFDIETGRELWKGRLPAGGQATPMSYESAGRQFVVIAAGGHGGLGTKQGDYVIGFALPASAP